MEATYEPIYTQEAFDRLLSKPTSIEDGQAQVQETLTLRDTILTRRGVLLNQQLDLEDEIAARGPAATAADKHTLEKIILEIEQLDKQVVNSYEYTHKIIDHVEACNEGSEIFYPYPDDYDLLVYLTDVLDMHRKATEPKEDEIFGEEEGEDSDEDEEMVDVDSSV
ncbi:hypothetical protein BGX29_008335 [Mortierella sp. GBA35]|nr:hypothetical protein BGX29_008335 [Mortierella sp. GBA35]